MHFSPSQLSVTAWAAAMAGCYISSTPVLLTNAAALLPQSYYEGKGARASSFGNSSSSSDHMCGDAVWTLEDAARLAWSHAALRVFDPKLLAAVDRVVPGELRKQSCHPAGADPNLVSMLLMAHASWMQYDAGLYRASALALEPVLESLPVEELVTIAWCFSMGLLRHARKEAYKASTVTFTTAAAAVAVTQPGADKAEHQQQSMLACRAILQHISSLLAGLRPDVLIRRELRQLAQAFTAATEASALLNEAATQANSIGTTLQRTPSAAAAVPAMSAAAGSSSSPLRLSPALHMAAFSAWSAVGGAKNLGRRRAVVELADALCNLGCLHVSMDGRCSHSGVPIDVVATQPGGKVADRSADAAAGSLAAASAATVRAGEKGSKQQARGKAGKGGKDDSAEEHEGEELGLSMMAKKNRSHATLRAAPETMVETADGGQLRLSANGSGGMVVQRVVRYAVLLCTDDQLSRYPAANSAGAAPRAATVLRAAALQRGGWVVVLVGQGWWLSYASREQQRAALAGLLAAARAAPRQTAAAGAAGQAVMRML